ncbi:MAG TPA: hypothetical protein VK206_17280 [Anaerolineales bacterium]|nr:hypothetical protein [Anaerolineales bacterium]HLO30704.1 hypothetical protein [Anaerolineales bacterium]
MSLQKRLQLIVGLTVVALMLVGCDTSAATPISSMARPIPLPGTLRFTSSSAPVGKVEPMPEGCLYMEFFSPSDDSAYEHDQSGRINAIITPTGRIEPLQKPWTLKDFEEAIYNPDESSPDRRYLPGIVAWEYLKTYLEPADQIWTFGVLDTGFVIIREDKVFSVVVTDHSF